MGNLFAHADILSSHPGGTFLRAATEVLSANSFNPPNQPPTVVGRFLTPRPNKKLIFCHCEACKAVAISTISKTAGCYSAILKSVWKVSPEDVNISCIRIGKDQVIPVALLTPKPSHAHPLRQHY
jgi:hypothetical protein